MAAVKQGCKSASVKAVRLNEYPARVRIEYNGQVIWESAQRNLFRKYAGKRKQSMAEIADAVRRVVAA